MLYVGLDLSTRNTGIAVLDEAGNVVKLCCVGHELKRNAREKDKIERLLNIASGVFNVIEDLPGRAQGDVRVGIERFAYRAIGSQNDLGELHGVVKSQLWLRYQIEPEMVGVSTARKVVLGKGNTKKDEVFRLVSAMGIAVRSDDESDAYLIAKCLQSGWRKGVESGTKKRSKKGDRKTKGAAQKELFSEAKRDAGSGGRSSRQRGG
jgi:Holliday junction resolvasome RuvABC endonuclease subunit